MAHLVSQIRVTLVAQAQLHRRGQPPRVAAAVVLVVSAVTGPAITVEPAGPVLRPALQVPLCLAQEVAVDRVIPAGLLPLVEAQVITARRLTAQRTPEAGAVEVATEMVEQAAAVS